jgi:hypothetical protein
MKKKNLVRPVSLILSTTMQLMITASAALAAPNPAATSKIVPATTVRISQLANLQAALAMVSTCIEGSLLLLGVYQIVRTLIARKSKSIDKRELVFKLAIGFSLIIIGLTVPGFINWLYLCALESPGRP